MKRTKKVEPDIDPRFNSRCETFDKDAPKAVFLNLSTWITPVNDDETINYHLISKNLRKAIKQTIYNNIDGDVFHKKRTIVDLNLKESGIKYNKKSYMECEITLYQRLHYSFDDIYSDIKNIMELMLNNAILPSLYFSFDSKK